jgi:hypothetical protein
MMRFPRSVHPESVGDRVGLDEGEPVGLFVGDELGLLLGLADGEVDGD